MNAPSSLRLDHVVVPVHDALEARRFYRDVLGLPLLTAFHGDDWGGRPWLMMVFGLGEGGQHLVATAFAGIDAPAASPFPRDARHNAFAVESESAWRAWKGRLAGAKAEFWEEDHGDQRSLYVVDPSGNVLEIATPPSAPMPPRGGAEETPDAIVERWARGTRVITSAP